MTPPNQDQEQLRHLSIGYYVMAGISCVFGLFPLLHVGIGVSVLLGKGPFAAGASAAGPPPWFGWLFIVVGTSIIVIAQTTAILNLLAARALADRRRRTLCLVAAGLNCLN